VERRRQPVRPDQGLFGVLLRCKSVQAITWRAHSCCLQPFRTSFNGSSRKPLFSAYAQVRAC
jgi:hypothetical protein